MVFITLEGVGKASKEEMNGMWFNDTECETLKKIKVSFLQLLWLYLHMEALTWKSLTNPVLLIPHDVLSDTWQTTAADKCMT